MEVVFPTETCISRRRKCDLVVIRDVPANVHDQVAARVWAIERCRQMIEECKAAGSTTIATIVTSLLADDLFVDLIYPHLSVDDVMAQITACLRETEPTATIAADDEVSLPFEDAEGWGPTYGDFVPPFQITITSHGRIPVEMSLNGLDSDLSLDGFRLSWDGTTSKATLDFEKVTIALNQPRQLSPLSHLSFVLRQGSISEPYWFRRNSQFSPAPLQSPLRTTTADELADVTDEFQRTILLLTVGSSSISVARSSLEVWGLTTHVFLDPPTVMRALPLLEIPTVSHEAPPPPPPADTYRSEVGAKILGTIDEWPASTKYTVRFVEGAGPSVSVVACSRASLYASSQQIFNLESSPMIFLKASIRGSIESTTVRPVFEADDCSRRSSLLLDQNVQLSIKSIGFFAAEVNTAGTLFINSVCAQRAVRWATLCEFLDGIHSFSPPSSPLARGQLEESHIINALCKHGDYETRNPGCLPIIGPMNIAVEGCSQSQYLLDARAPPQNVGIPLKLRTLEGDEVRTLWEKKTRTIRSKIISPHTDICLNFHSLLILTRWARALSVAKDDHKAPKELSVPKRRESTCEHDCEATCHDKRSRRGTTATAMDIAMDAGFLTLELANCPVPLNDRSPSPIDPSSTTRTLQVALSALRVRASMSAEGAIQAKCGLADVLVQTWNDAERFVIVRSQHTSDRCDNAAWHQACRGHQTQDYDPVEHMAASAYEIGLQGSPDSYYDRSVGSNPIRSFVDVDLRIVTEQPIRAAISLNRTMEVFWDRASVAALKTFVASFTAVTLSEEGTEALKLLLDVVGKKCIDRRTYLGTASRADTWSAFSGAFLPAPAPLSYEGQLSVALDVAVAAPVRVWMYARGSKAFMAQFNHLALSLSMREDKALMGIKGHLGPLQCLDARRGPELRWLLSPLEGVENSASVLFDVDLINQAVIYSDGSVAVPGVYVDARVGPCHVNFALYDVLSLWNTFLSEVLGAITSRPNILLKIDEDEARIVASTFLNSSMADRLFLDNIGKLHPSDLKSLYMSILWLTRPTSLFPEDAVRKFSCNRVPHAIPTSI